MDKRRRLREAGRRLERAVDGQDWVEAGIADSELGRVLASFAGAALTAADRSAIDEAGAAHAQARRRCEDACVQLEARLGEMRGHKEGWIAYAMNGEPQESAS